MRKQIKSTSYIAQLKADIQALESTKQRRHDEKKAAKENWEKADKTLTKDERKLLKIAFLRAKIRYKAAEMAHKAALKIISPYLDDVSNKSEDIVKNDKHKKDTAEKSTASKVVKTKKVKTESAKTTSKKAAKADKIEKVVQAEKVVQTKKQPKTVKIVQPKADDLTTIEGIGAKISQILNTNGVTTFSQLASTPFEDIKAWLKSNRMNFVDCTTWAEQAQLAADGKMEAFEALKSQLKGGKRI